ncbi:MAG TPA: replication-relaxation family protein [Candidatus Angelobacter sp.]|nr:replication-relaxation family protein [Candidatus Angelobacter sp.]
MSGNKARPMILQKRDLEFFRILGRDARLVDREQAMKFAGFTSQTRINARLLKLTANGFLRRYFLGTFKGGSKALYTLSPKGAQVAEVQNRPVIRPKETLLIGDPFVNHQLAVNDVHIAARFTPVSQFKVLRFRSFSEPLTKVIPLIPDGYFEIGTPLGVRAAFIEVDCGTESLKVWAKKTSLYLELAISGIFKKIFEQQQFRVLVIASSGRRADSIRKIVLRQTQKIFWFTTLEQIKAEGFWSAIWFRPEGSQRLSLLERNL